MRFFIIFLIATASMANAQSVRVTDKASCMSHLKRAITMAEINSDGDGPSVLRHQIDVFSDVQDRESADIILGAYAEIGGQYRLISDTLFKLCASYD